VKITDFLENLVSQERSPPPSEDFLKEINKKTTKYLLFYDENCPKSQFLLASAPKTTKLIFLNQKLDWVHEISKILHINRIPSIAIVKSGNINAQKILNFNESSYLLKTL